MCEGKRVAGYRGYGL